MTRKVEWPVISAPSRIAHPEKIAVRQDLCCCLSKAGAHAAPFESRPLCILNSHGRRGSAPTAPTSSSWPQRSTAQCHRMKVVRPFPFSVPTHPSRSIPVFLRCCSGHGIQAKAYPFQPGSITRLITCTSRCQQTMSAESTEGFLTSKARRKRKIGIMAPSASPAGRSTRFAAAVGAGDFTWNFEGASQLGWVSAPGPARWREAGREGVVHRSKHRERSGLSRAPV